MGRACPLWLALRPVVLGGVWDPRSRVRCGATCKLLRCSEIRYTVTGCPVRLVRKFGVYVLTSASFFPPPPSPSGAPRSFMNFTGSIAVDESRLPLWTS